ncbi:MAG: hypothetical protein OWQ48_04155 [Desulfurococcus sp.]|nr:hypothetical protein [Desulfurococcus sp.]
MNTMKTDSPTIRDKKGLLNKIKNTRTIRDIMNSELKIDRILIASSRVENPLVKIAYGAPTATARSKSAVVTMYSMYWKTFSFQ